MASRDLHMLVPALHDKADQWLHKCSTSGIRVSITCTARLVKEQIALYAQGREDLYHVNYLRSRAGLTLLTPQQNMRKVTWTLKSKHLVDLDDQDESNDLSRAFDFCILLENGQVTWDLKADVDKDRIPDYTEAGLIAESLDLRWGGRWRNPDYPHIEI